MKVNVIILNYNGKDLMKECLPSVVEAAQFSKHNCTVTVLDNKSSDDSTDFLKKNFSSVKIYEARQNKVYCSYNEIAKTIDDDIMIVLNNDIKIDKGYIDPLIEPFLHNEDLLFTAPKGYSFDGQRYEGDRSKAAIRWGIIEPQVTYKDYEKDINLPGHAFSAGVGAFDRKKIILLGGYDEIYLPGRYEDVDLCYRGWKRGWKGLYQPQSMQYHKGGASFKKEYDSQRVSKLVFRNSIIFMVKNVSDFYLLTKFYIFTALRTILYLIMGRFYMVGGFLSAIKMIPAIIARENTESRFFILNDAQVLKKINNN